MSKKRYPDNASYEVGYSRPPVATRWQPGQSGNRKGRPKGNKNVHTIVQASLNELIELKSNGQTRKVSLKEGLIRQIFSKAASGDKQSILIALKLISASDAREELLAAQRHKLSFTEIDPSMTHKEAADAYAETLEAIAGIPEGFLWEGQ